jgi:hypothetical protein
MTDSSPVHPHLAAIGFVALDVEDIPALADLAAHAATPVETRGGLCYLHWAGKSGAEMWLQLSRDSKLIGLLPHFAGRSRTRIALTELVNREDKTELDQAYYAWAEPEPGEERRTFPFVFDCPNPLVHSDLPCPTVATLQLTAFPFDVTLYPTVAAFQAEHEDEDETTPESFTAIGLAPADGVPLRTAESLAMINGVVKATATYENELTHESFHWALIECMRAELDVVIDPSTVPDPPVVGGVVSGLFSLSGRFVEYEKVRPLFGRARGIT